jgi:hypothetical protein
MRPTDANGGAELDSGGTHASTGRPLPGMEETEEGRLSTDFSEREEEPRKDS